MLKNMKFKTKILITIPLLSVLIWGTITFFLISSSFSQIKELSQIYATQLTEKYAKNLKVEFSRYFEIVEAITIQCEYLIEENPDLLATWVCFEENGFDKNDNSFKHLIGSDDSDRYIPYFHRKKKSILLESLIDYEDLVDGKIVETAGVDLTVTEILKLIKAIKYYDTGLGGTVNPNNGVVTLHKEDNLVLQEHKLIKKYSKEVVNKNITKLEQSFSRESYEELIFVMPPISLGDDTWIMYTTAPVNEVLKSANTLLIAGIMSYVFAFAIIIITITKNIEKTLTRITTYASSISNGDFSISIQERALQSKDEFGTLSNAFAKVVETLKSLAEETTQLTNLTINKKFYIRGNTFDFEGGYKKIVQGLNSTIDTFIHHMDSIPTPIAIIDREYNIQYINKEGAYLLGITEKELIGKKCYDCFNTENCKTSNCVCSRAMDKRTKVNSDTISRPNGLEFEIIHYGTSLKNMNGNIIGALQVFIDETNIRKAQREKIQAIEKEEALKDEFFANISHELRTPINVIYSALQLEDIYLANRDIDGILKHHGVIKQNCFRLTKIINNIIDITKINAGFIKPIFKINNIVYLVENITQSIITYTEHKNINTIFDTDYEELYVKSDPDFIERIILNLLSNSIKYGKINGTIKVAIEKDEKENVVILIKDDGIGISEENLSKIFNRFEKVDKTLARENEGSGIGLYLVKSLVEIQNGSISLNSTLNKGTEILIKFPLIKGYDEVSCTTENPKSIDNNTLIEKINIELSDIYF